MENLEPHQSFNTVEEGKVAAIVAYLSLIGLVIAFVMNNEKKNTFAAFHIRQSIGIQLTGVALGMIAIIPFLGWIIAGVGILLVFILWINGIVNAIGGKEKPVIILGDKYSEWFASIR